MDRPKWEVADIFRRYGEAYREKHGGRMSTAQRRVISAIQACRTAALGGQIEQCDTCGHRRICYRSCRNPSLPKMSVSGSRRVDSTPPGRTPRRSVLPRRVHGPGRDCRDRSPEQGGRLQHSLPGHGRNLTHDSRRFTAPRRVASVTSSGRAFGLPCPCGAILRRGSHRERCSSSRRYGNGRGYARRLKAGRVAVAP